MLSLPWMQLVLFMVSVELVALYGLTLSGHFPAEFRAEQFKRGSGAIFMWATLAIASLAASVSLAAAWTMLPWYATVIGAGATLLAAPLVLQAFSDRFVNGHAGLAIFAAGAAASSAAMWATA